MTITLRGLNFLNETQVMRRRALEVVINPSAGNLIAVDAAKGGAVTVAVPLVSVTIQTEDGSAAATGTLPATVDVTFGYVQPQYALSGERVISANIPDLTGGTDFHGTSTTCTAFESYGTVWVAPPAATTPADTASPGTGLLGRYFGNRDLVGQPVYEVVQKPYYYGYGSSINPAVPDNNFSVRWTGRIKFPTTGKYRFAAESDDGVRVYLNGRLIIDSWVDQAAWRYTGYFDLTAADIQALWIEQFNGQNGVGMMKLWWEPATGDGQLVEVPITALYSTDGTDVLPAVEPPPPQTLFYGEIVNRYG